MIDVCLEITILNYLLAPFLLYVKNFKTVSRTKTTQEKASCRGGGAIGMWPPQVQVLNIKTRNLKNEVEKGSIII